MTDTLTPAARHVWDCAPLRFKRGRVPMGPTQLAIHVCYSKTRTRDHLLALVDAGLVEKVPQGPYRNLYAGKQNID